MVAAQWGETRDPDARTSGGVSGRFRLLGGSGEPPHTTPPPFGTAPWGYRRSEVDAWASWVAGLVAHGRNETIRADSAEATLKATLERLRQVERPDAGSAPTADPGDALPTPPVNAGHDGPGPAGATGDADGAAPEPPGAAGPIPHDGQDARPSGGLHVDPPPDPPSDLPRRPVRGATTPSAEQAANPAGSPGESTSDGEGTGPSHTPPRDHDMTRLRIVETTLHEVLELLHHLADRK